MRMFIYPTLLQQQKYTEVLSKDYEKDIFLILADGVEPSHETRQLQRIRRTTPVNSTLENI